MAACWACVAAASCERFLQRSRMVLTSLVDVRPDLPAMRTIEESLRLRLRCFDQKLGGGMLKACVGRNDVSQHILSFLDVDQPLVDTNVGGKMFSDSGSANVDLFFHSMSQGKPDKNGKLGKMLEEAWSENPEICLKQNLPAWSQHGREAGQVFLLIRQLCWPTCTTFLSATIGRPCWNFWPVFAKVQAGAWSVTWRSTIATCAGAPSAKGRRKSPCEMLRPVLCLPLST